MVTLNNTNQRDDGIDLELSLRQPPPLPPPIEPPPPPPPPIQPQKNRPENTPITPPYPWSTEQRAVIHKLEYLRSHNILTIRGDVKCKQCNGRYEMEYDLVEKLVEVESYIEMNKGIWHDRAPIIWLNPVLPNCNLCNKENCVEPVIPDGEENNHEINWLFLLLGQLLGRLKHQQLKYFCAHTKNHRTGAKNRLLYLTYLALCNQLQPSNPLFNILP